MKEKNLEYAVYVFLLEREIYLMEIKYREREGGQGD